MAILKVVFAVVIAVIARVGADEVKAWLPVVSRSLLHLALLRLPSEQRERFSEEWTADLLDYPGEISRAIRALGMCCAAVKIRFVLRPKFVLESVGMTLAPMNRSRKFIYIFALMLVTLSIALTTRHAHLSVARLALMHAGGALGVSLGLLRIYIKRRPA